MALPKYDLAIPAHDGPVDLEPVNSSCDGKHSRSDNAQYFRIVSGGIRGKVWKEYSIHGHLACNSAHKKQIHYHCEPQGYVLLVPSLIAARPPL